MWYVHPNLDPPRSPAAQVSGTAYLNGSTVEIQVAMDQGSDTRRLGLINATQIVGSFASIRVKGDEQRTSKDGTCTSYFVASTDRVGGELSVLIVPKEEACKGGGSSKRWVVSGVVLGVVGGLVITTGLMYVFREAADRWARRPTDDEGTLLV